MRNTYTNYCKRSNFRWGQFFVGKLPHENLYTWRITCRNSNYNWLLLHAKNAFKILTHEIMWPRNLYVYGKFSSLLIIDGSIDTGNLSIKLYMVVWCHCSSVYYCQVHRPSKVDAEGLFDSLRNALRSLEELKWMPKQQQATNIHEDGVGSDRAADNIAQRGLNALLMCNLGGCFTGNFVHMKN